MASELCLKSKENAADKITTKKLNQLRKPKMEKARRDRVNTSIKEIHKLLVHEFKILQPNSKTEKSAILESAVQLIKEKQISQSMQAYPRSDQPEYSRGYYTCILEAFNYLSAQLPGQEAPVKLLNHFYQMEMQERPLRCLPLPPQPLVAHTQPVWRPW